MTEPGRAIVLGAGIAGLCAARVLSDRFDEVLVQDRDELPDGPLDRKLLPQGPFVHVLLGRGQALLDRWFPGLDAALADHGAPRMDWARDSRVFHLGAWMPRFDSDIVVRTSPRAVLEFAVRSQLLALPNVRVIDRARAVAPLGDRAGITGVRCDDGTEHLGTLVVDATGRASKSPDWLEGLGLGRPGTTTVKPATAYATRLFKAPAAQLGFRCMYLMPQGPAQPRSDLIYPIEGGRWGVNLFAYDGSPLPADEDFFAFAASLARPDLHDALLQAEPVSEVRRYKNAGNRRVHFDEIARWPSGFAVIVAASCALNPVYGQGMTLAAMGAELLERELGRRGRFDARRFQRRLTRLQAGPWEMSTIEDLRWSSTTCRQGPKARAAQRYTDRVHRAAQTDLSLYRVLAHVIHLARPATDLVKPWAAWRTRRANPSSAAGAVQREGVGA